MAIMQIWKEGRVCFTGTDFTIRRPYGEKRVSGAAGERQKVSAVHNLHICELNGALAGHLQLPRKRKKGEFSTPNIR